MYLILSVLIMCEWKEIEEKFWGRTRINLFLNQIFSLSGDKIAVLKYYPTQYANDIENRVNFL